MTRATLRFSLSENRGKSGEHVKHFTAAAREMYEGKSERILISRRNFTMLHFSSSHASARLSNARDLYAIITAIITNIVLLLILRCHRIFLRKLVTGLDST